MTYTQLGRLDKSPSWSGANRFSLWIWNVGSLKARNPRKLKLRSRSWGWVPWDYVKLCLLNNVKKMWNVSLKVIGCFSEKPTRLPGVHVIALVHLIPRSWPRQNGNCTETFRIENLSPRDVTSWIRCASWLYYKNHRSVPLLGFFATTSVLHIETYMVTSLEVQMSRHGVLWNHIESHCVYIYIHMHHDKT